MAQTATKKHVANLQHVVHIGAHVPVDRFSIVNGPKLKECKEIQKELHRRASERGHPRVSVMFTFVTGASKSEFRRIVEVYSFWEVSSGAYAFTALFNNNDMSGVYDVNTKTGTFAVS